MNNTDKNSKVFDDNKNCKVPVSRKEVIQRSAHIRNKPYASDATDGLRLCNRADEKTGLDVSTAITKRLSCTLKKKSPQIHECGEKVYTDKFCRAHLANAALKIERYPRNQIKDEKKYSKVVVSDVKPSIFASRKAQSAFKTNDDTVIDNSRNISKKTLCITNRNRSLSKAKVVSGTATRRVYKEKDCNWKREESSRTTVKELKEVNPKQANHCIGKKYPESVNVKDKIKSYSKRRNNIADKLKGTKEAEIINPQQIIEVKQTVHKKIIFKDIDANVEANGAARTRIFQCTKRSQNLTKCKDGIQERGEEYSKNEFETRNPLPVEKQNQNEQENESRNSTKPKSEQDPIDSCCNIKDDKIINLYNGGIATPESGIDSNQHQEFEETFVTAAEERGNNSSSLTSSKTSCKQTSSGDTKIDLSEGNISRFSEATEVSWDQNLSKEDKNRAISDSIKILGHDYEKTEKLLTNSKVPSISQDQVTYHTNLLNYGYHSAQQYCKRSSKKNKWNTPNAASRFTGADENQSTVSDDAKYNLMKTLIQPATVIHDFKGTGNNIGKLLSARGSERVLTCGNEGLLNCYINSSSNGSINEETLNVSSSVKQLEDNTSNLTGCAVWNQHSNPIHRKQPISNSSNYIGLNSKLKSCKYTKKYRHFKHEDKNMRSNVARYIKRMVSKERKYQEFQKQENLGREEVKIIIDENSAKTSKIRIVNDRSSVSVVCHSLERTLSPSKGRHNDPASKTESSGGESSGYKSFHDNSDTKNVDSSDQNETQHSAIIMTYDHGHGKQNTEMKYLSNDAKNYLSTFTNCMDIYLPCEITAYQFEERNKGQTLQLTNKKEHVDTNLDNVELHVGKYSDERNSDGTDDSSEGEESSEWLDPVEDFTTAGDKVMMLKRPNEPKYESIEFVVDERFLEPDVSGLRIDSTDIPTVPAQYRIVTSVLDLEPEEITESSESSETPTNASQVKFTMENNRSTAIVKFSNDDIERDLSDITFPPTPPVRSKDIYKRSGSHGTTCSGRLKNKNNRSAYSNAVHELWTNKKSTVDSTDNESQSSGRTGCGKSYSKKRDTNKFKFNIFKKSKSSASEKTIGIPLNQLPNPPPSFLHTSVSTQSTTFFSTANTDALESKIATKPHAFTAPILRTNSFTMPLPDTARVHYAQKTHRDTVSNETIIHLQLHTDESNSIAHKDAETDPESSTALPLDERLISQELHSAVPPPASALPPPYPFCCPLVPYMMQYWQNNQQPPPPSTVPLPEADWKATVSAGSEPPPPGMIPIPWFPPILHMNNPPQSGEMDPNTSNTLHSQLPPDWQMKPRGYAPCLPCSKFPEPHLRKTDSPIHEEDEPALDISESRQDGRKKKVSDKLFKIFRRKNRADIDTVDEDDKKSKVRHLQSRSVTRSNNVPVEQHDQQNLDDRSIWESPDIAGIVTPEEIGRCFRRGFRPDGLTLSGDDYLCTKAPSDTTSEQEDTFNFSDHDTPLDFLLGLGFSVDEATAAIRDDEVRNRFKAALTEARIWVPHIATTQGTLLYLLAMKAKQKVMRYFLQLVEAIVNKRITNAVKLDAYLKILEMVEDGYVSFVTLFGKDTGKDDEEDTVIVEKQRRRILYTIYKYAESEAKEVNRPLTRASVDLLHSLAARYRSAIGPHLQLLACYIGEGLLTKDVQLEAAVIYLSRLDSAYVQLADLEKYCGLPPSERRRAEQAAKTKS